MKYSKKYLKEKWDSIKNDVENILLSNLEEDYVEFPDSIGIKENLNDKWEAIKNELQL